MALSYSTGARFFAAMLGSYKRAFQGGTLEIRTSAPPATADAADTSSVLNIISSGSLPVTKEVLSYGTVTLSGSGGQVDGITVNGLQVLGAVVPWNTDLTTTAAAVATQINTYVPVDGCEYFATSSGAAITITALPGTGTTPNGFVVVTTVSGGTLAKVDVNFANGVASVNGLTYGAATGGILLKSGVWSGVNILSGTAGHFRLLGSVNDTGGSSTTLPRIQGTCGIGSGDLPLVSTALEVGATHTVDLFQLILPA